MSKLHTTGAAGTISRMWADNVGSKFLDSLAQLLIYEQSKLPKGKYIHYETPTVSWHELARNQIVEKVQGDWLLMLDTDHVFAPDLLERLMRIKKKYKAQVISGTYQYKFPPHAPVANMWEETDKGLKVRPITAWDRNADAISVGPMPGGCLLVDKSVLRRMMAELNEKPFQIIPGLSEDYSFCFRCKKLGIPVYWAPRVESHHIIPNVLSVQDYVFPAGLEPTRTENGVMIETGEQR